MSTQGKHPAYLVICTRPNRDPIRTRFSDSHLLTARRAAMALAEKLWLDCSQLEEAAKIACQIAVYLIEQEDSASDFDQIARILRAQMTLLPDGRIAGTGELPLDEVPTEQLNCLDKLKQLNEEAYYYLKNEHSTGFGTFDVTLQSENKPNSPMNIGHILFDALATVYAAVGSYNSNMNASRGYEFRLICSTAYYASGDESMPTDTIADLALDS